MFIVIKYVDTLFGLPDADKDTYYIGENEIRWVWGRDRGWIIFGVSDVGGLEDEKLTPFSIFQIWLKQ